MKIREQLNPMVLALILLFIGVVVAAIQQHFCQYIEFLDIDYCWLFSADAIELQRGFPRYYLVVYFMNLFLDYGIVSIGILIFVVSNLKGIKENAILLISSTVFTLVIGEFGLRTLGYNPGQFGYSQWVHPVDSLVELEGYSTDNYGITKVDTGFSSKVLHFPKSYVDSYSISGRDKYFSNEVFTVLADHRRYFDVDFPENEFWRRVNGLSDKPALCLDSLIVNYHNAPINEHGFYSLPFDKRCTGLAVLLLGDSFTWGHSVDDQTSSFSNILLSRGLEVYNTGISGADVSQYIEVLRKYGPVLKPKLVVCNFFMGNDVQYFERNPKKDIPLFFYTNAGVIYSNHNGVQFSTAQKAYSNIMKNMVIPDGSKTNRIMSYSVITTYLWELFVHHGIIKHEFFLGKTYPQEPITASQVQTLSELCDSINAKLIVSVIPKLDGQTLIGAESIPGLFGETPIHEPEMTPDHYNKKDGHFNELGHLVYANYMENLIRSELEKPSPVEQ